MVEEDQEACVTLWSQSAEINVSVESGPGYFGMLPSLMDVIVYNMAIQYVLDTFENQHWTPSVATLFPLFDQSLVVSDLNLRTIPKPLDSIPEFLIQCKTRSFSFAIHHVLVYYH
jgi:hypothetical protein